MTLKSATTKRPKRTTRTRPIRVGDKVTFAIGPQRWRALVVEDRGRYGRTRILRVRTLSRSPGAESTFEVPENEVALLRPRPGKNGKS
jgi:hypothetical protein